MIEYFSKLTPKEVKEFEKFVNSPYHNTTRTSVIIFRYLKSKYPNIEITDLDRKKVYRAMYRKGKFNVGKFKKAISEFSRLMNRFLVQVEFETTDGSNNLLLAQALRKRNFDKSIEYLYKDIKWQNEKVTSRSSQFYYYKYNLEEEFALFNDPKKRQKDCKHIFHP